MTAVLIAAQVLAIAATCRIWYVVGRLHGERRQVRHFIDSDKSCQIVAEILDGRTAQHTLHVARVN